MSNLRFQPLTNVRPSKEQGTHLITNTTKGSLKLTPKAGKILEVQDGGHCGVVKAGDQVFVFKGNDDLGGKLASSKKGGAGDLHFSSAMSWQELDGNSETKRYYAVGETPLSEEDVAGSPFEGMKLFPLTFEKEEAKQARSTSDDSDSDSDSVTQDPTISEKGNTVMASEEDAVMASDEGDDLGSDDFSDL